MKIISLAEELKSVMNRLGQKLTDEEISLMIKEADTDGDRKVSFKGNYTSYFSFLKL